MAGSAQLAVPDALGHISVSFRGIDRPSGRRDDILAVVQVNAVLVDEITLHGSSRPRARPVLYTFASPSLVSASRLDTPNRIGPIGVLEGEEAVAVQTFPERPLDWLREGDSFAYKEPWTALPWTLYVLLPPRDFLASTVEVRDMSGAASFIIDPASFGDRLFYFSLLGHAPDRHGVQVEAQIEHDPKRGRSGTLW